MIRRGDQHIHLTSLVRPGDPSNPTIVYPTWYSGTITDGNEWLIALPGKKPSTRSLDPSRFFIIVPGLFGNGESTFPSNHPRRFSQAFYREEEFKNNFGLDGASNILNNFWHAWSTSKDADNLLYSQNKTDLYFPPEDSENEAKVMGEKAQLEVIPSIWGHWAGGPGDSKENVKWLDDKICEFFQ
ncbi:hypothetical protein NDA13_002696 [Ustilago tritici]|nr:hypothetical protein NDA13_002696 [Ustilago tritici]